MRTVQLLEGAAISVARKIISRTYVLDTRLSPRLARILCIVSKMSFRTKFFGVEEISAVTLDDSQLVTLMLESGNYLLFQPDTGAQCNVVPLHLYKKATKDVD